MYWCRAWRRDVPIARDDVTRSAEALRNAKKRWLLYSDDKTAGLPGLFPLVGELPMRWTDTEDFEHNACKHAPCTLVGWTLEDMDLQKVQSSQDSEVVLSTLPKWLYVKIPGATWHWDECLPPGVMPVKAKTATWDRMPPNQAYVRRTSFPLVPNFAATAHSVTGRTLDVLIADLLGDERTPTASDVAPCYVGISRNPDPKIFFIAQPFAPGLFGMGKQTGPHLLEQWTKYELTAEELEKEWLKSEGAEGKKPSSRLLGITFPCASCGFAKKNTCFSFASACRYSWCMESRSHSCSHGGLEALHYLRTAIEQTECNGRVIET